MASPEDILSKRNQLQQQILELETALGADSSIIGLLSSSSDSDEESDDSGHAEEEPVSENLEAKRQQIQKEIEALEQTLGTDAALVAGLTDSEHGSHVDSSEEDSDEELDLPQDVETCLQMNLVYQEVLKEKLADLERLLTENRQQQKELETQVSAPVYAYPGLPHMKLFLGTFMKPYFKDKLTGLGPPANEETKEKLSHGTRPYDEMKIRRWEGWQKTLLTNSVVSDTMKRMLQPKMSRLDYLTAKMSKAKDVEKEELKNQIALLEKNIEEISSTSEDQLYGDRHDDHDWDKIANTDFEGVRQPEDLMRFWQNYLHPSINKSVWTEEEVDELSAVAEQFNCCNWDKIAEALGTNRTAFMCFQTYQRYVAKTFRRRPWNKEEDRILRDLVEKMKIGNFIPYTQISYFMEARDSGQIMYRWTNVLDPSLKKGPWSKEEDELLRKAVDKYGLKDWWKVRLEVPGRTDNACRDRYLDCLQDNVKKGPWSDEEVELLNKLVEKHGAGKWAKIASEFPNRTDTQCLHKWKWMVRTAANQGVKPANILSLKLNTKRKKVETEKSNVSKKRKVNRKRIKKEEDIVSTSEDEEVKVEYMDSDGEKEECNLPCEDDTGPEEHREEYIQPDMKEWIPVDQKAKTNPQETIRTTLVRLPTDEESTGDCRYTRCTTVNNLGCAVKTCIIKEPVALDKSEFCNDNAMIFVRMDDVKKLLKWMKQNAMEARDKGKPWRFSAKKRQMNVQSDGQNTSNEQMKSGQAVKCKQKTCVSKAVSNISIEYDLLLSLIPWIGNVLTPLSFTEKQVCEADIAGTRAAAVPLTRTPLFLLFLKVLQIDVEGCKKAIDAQKYKPISQPVKYRPPPAGKTVAMLLAEKKARKAAQLSDAKQPSPTTNQQIPQQIKNPQAFVITQPNVHQGVLSPHPVGPRIVHLLQSGAQTSQTVPPVLQLVAPVEPSTSAQMLAPPTSAISSPSTPVPPTEDAQKTKTSKRKCKPTMKAQALKENVKNKPSKKRAAKNNDNDAAPTVAVLPPAIAWILTPAGLMPVQLQTGGVADIQSQVLPNNVHQALLQPPAIVNQNGLVQATGPSNTTAVTPPKVASLGPNLAQNISPSSNSSNSPNISSLPSVPNVSSAVSITTSVPLVQMASLGVLGSPNQRVSDSASQVVLQQPIIMNQNDSMVSAAGQHLATNVPPAPMARVSKAPPNPATSSASANNVPDVQTVNPTPVAGSVSSTVATSHAVPQAKIAYGFTVPVQQSLPNPAVQSITNSAVMTPSQILPENVVLQTSLQTGMQPLHTTTAPQGPNTLSYDPNLMFLEHPDLVKDWMMGKSGISLPQRDKKMPYLPPFVSNISTLASLLKAKESFMERAVQLLPEEEQANSEEEAKVAAIRKLVSEKFNTNPAYSLLKARFLSCFTLPALLATINPCKESKSAMLGSDDEDNKERVELIQGENKDQPAVNLLNTNASEASATEFSGMSTNKKSTEHTEARQAPT